MIKFYLSKSVKSEYLKASDITVSANRLEMSINRMDIDIFTFDLSYLRDTISTLQSFAEIGLFTDIDGVKGLVTYSNRIVDFFYTKDECKQIIENNNDLQSIRFPYLKSKLYIDTVPLCDSSMTLRKLSINDIVYVADNGVIFNCNDKLYSLIF